MSNARTIPSYTTNDPKGWCGDPSRGAAMGRPTLRGEPEGSITVRETVLDSGGYDRNGTYFGQGPALYWYADEGGNVDDVFRLETHLDSYQTEERLQEAVALVRQRYPEMTITTAKAIRTKCCGLGDSPCIDGGADAADYSDYCETCSSDEGSSCATCGERCIEVGPLDKEDGDCPACTTEKNPWGFDSQGAENQEGVTG